MALTTTFHPWFHVGKKIAGDVVERTFQVTKLVVSFDSADRKKMQTSWGFQDVQGWEGNKHTDVFSTRGWTHEVLDGEKNAT